ncbi:MAG: AAA family ATPase, partial [Candidatus Paceibacterota bacterium]
ILAIIGLYGSGKSEAAKYLSKKDLPIVHFGSVVNKRVEKQGLTHTEENHRKIREAIRKEYGMEAMAVLNRDKIKTALKDRGLIVIDGLRSFEEYDYLHKQFEDVEIRIIAIWASEKTRKSRIGKRRYNRALRGKKRDINEVLYANMGPTIALADHIVVNESSLEDFHYRLENIYREIYYS